MSPKQYAWKEAGGIRDQRDNWDAMSCSSLCSQLTDRTCTIRDPERIVCRLSAISDIRWSGAGLPLPTNRRKELEF